jgi:hypothetical protein
LVIAAQSSLERDEEKWIRYSDRIPLKSPGINHDDFGLIQFKIIMT